MSETANGEMSAEAFRRDVPIDDLQRAADAGDTQAKLRLGVRLLARVGAPDDAKRGASLVAAAAREGEAEAASVAATLAGAGIGRSQSWPDALDLVQRAAQLGWAPAQEQLRVLAAGPAPGASIAQGEDWARLRSAVDVASWLTPPPKRAVRDGPLIRAVDGFASRAACDWLISRTHGRLARAKIYDSTSGDGGVDEGRTNTECDLDLEATDLIVLFFRERIAALTKLPPPTMELAKILHYDPGETFGDHYDFLDPAEPAFAKELQTRGQRLATFLVYLNEDYEGGVTDFPRIGLQHRGRTGDALYFANVHRAGGPDRDTLHAGRPTTRGEKWLFSQWIRDRAIM